MQFAFLSISFIESHDFCFARNGRARKVDGRSQALVGLGLATPLVIAEFIIICSSKRNFKMERVVVASGISGVRKGIDKIDEELTIF